MSTGSNNIAFARNVNSLVKKDSVHHPQQNGQATFGERLLFVIWLSGKVLGVENAQQFAKAVGKGASQLSRWVREDPRPNWDSIKRVADAVGVDALWLDEPGRKGAVEPPDFPEWLAARRLRAQPKGKRRASGGS